MSRNLGGADRTLRWTIGLALLALALLGELPTGWSMVAFILADAAQWTALFRFCPFNAALRIDTRPHTERSAAR